MFGIGFPEIILILIIALIVVGPSRLPEVARAIGKALGDFRRMADDVKDTLTEELTREEEEKPDEPEPLGLKDAQRPQESMPLPGEAPHEPLLQEEAQKGDGKRPGEGEREKADPYAQKGP